MRFIDDTNKNDFDSLTVELELDGETITKEDLAKICSFLKYDAESKIFLFVMYNEKKEIIEISRIQLEE